MIKIVDKDSIDRVQLGVCCREGKRPSKRGKYKKHGTWITHQLKNYKNNTDGMKSPERRRLWEEYVLTYKHLFPDFKKISQQEIKEDLMKADLSTLSVTKLKIIARELKIKGLRKYKAANKQDLIDLIKKERDEDVLYV